MPRVDVRTLKDPILFRLHLVAQEILHEEDGTEQTNWSQVVRVTRSEITRRGFSSHDIQWLGAADRDGRERVLRAFRAERDQKRKHQTLDKLTH
jgi:hypothetical protein